MYDFIKACDNRIKFLLFLVLSIMDRYESRFAESFIFPTSRTVELTFLLCCQLRRARFPLYYSKMKTSEASVM